MAQLQKEDASKRPTSYRYTELLPEGKLDLAAILQQYAAIKPEVARTVQHLQLKHHQLHLT